MLDETLVICGGEFGRTIYSQGKLTETNHGRDHHSRCFTTWVAGGGFKGGYVHGATDDFSHKAVEDIVNHYDYHHTLFHLFGLDPEALYFEHNGQKRRLIQADQSKIITKLLA